MAKNKQELITKIENELRTLSAKYKDYDYSNPEELKQARIEIRAEKDLINGLVNDLNQHITPEAGYRTELRTIQLSEEQHQYIIEIIPRHYVPRNQWEDAVEDTLKGLAHELKNFKMRQHNS